MILFLPSTFLPQATLIRRTRWRGATWIVSSLSKFLTEHVSHTPPGFLRVLDDLEQLTQSNNDPVALSAVREARVALDKLVSRMDNLESAFDRIAEKSCSCLHP